MNRTQCPSCSTIYMISDEQYRAADGMVRCGSCQTKFHATILMDEDAAKFDPAVTYIEPISEELITKAMKQEKAIREQETNGTFDDNFNSELSLSLEEEDNISTTDEESEPLLPASPPPVKNTPDSTALNNGLIDEVDRLVDEKLMAPSFTEPEQDNLDDNSTDYHDDFSLVRKKQRSLSSWLVLPILLLFVSAMSVTLIYQLWMKQLISWPDTPIVRNTLTPILTPVDNKLSEWGITLPIRRNLSGLDLLATQTEPHPTRPSTVLLRISLINRANISQPLPWLELSLNNADGRIISRRSLSPKNYVHNNRTDSNIGANELKKITIELLAFPAKATGYELRILNK